MSFSDEDWVSVVDSIQAAGVGAQSWDGALQGFADATGSRSAQLAGLDANTGVFLNIFTNIDPVAETVFPATVAINPRVRVVYDLPVLKTVTDLDFMTESACQTDPFYQEVLHPYDIPYVCLTTLERRQGSLFALCAVRSRAEGHITEAQKHIFASLAPHDRSAVRTHIALQGQSAAIALATLDGLSIPVFICDRDARVISHTQSAETLLRGARGLKLTAGRLIAQHAGEAQSLMEAISSSTSLLRRPGPPTTRTVVVRGGPNTVPLVLDVFRMPVGAHQFSLASFALVVARGSHASPLRRAALLRTLYSLTNAEIEIVQSFADGKSTNEIADARTASVATVRGQLKTIMAKLGVSRQVELLLRLSQL